jgi:glycosyltransferase involved in cell wall biosynthesis
MNQATICIDARLIGGTAGGVESVIQGLARGLSGLEDGDERYILLAYKGSDGWLRAHVSGPCRVHYCPIPAHERIKRVLSRRVPVLRRDLWQRLAWVMGWRRAGKIPSGEKLLHGLGVNLVHFPRQDAFAINVPSIYHPHDLLHRHFPEMFNEQEIGFRDFIYREFCSRASLVAVTSSWVREDLVEQFRISPDKVAVIPWGTNLDVPPRPDPKALNALHRKYNLPDRYLFYPAQTWPHKNHIGLIEALERIRKLRNETVPLVCSGRLTSYVGTIQKHLRDSEMQGWVRFVGFVSEEEVQSLCQGARGVVIPTKFEAASSPLWEAFALGVPAACSAVTSLPAQAGDAALLFDPYDLDDMAKKIWELWTNQQTRTALVERGRSRVQSYGLERAARHFRAHYRRILGVPLSEEDRNVLKASPLM